MGKDTTTEMRRWIHFAAKRVGSLLLVSLVGGLFGATLVRFAPGYGVDERELDPRLSRTSVEFIRNSHRLSSGIFTYYGHFLAGAVHGDLGDSQWLQRPISDLIRERFPLTVRSVLFGTSLAWLAAFAVSVGAACFPNLAVELSATLVSGFLIALPSAVVAMFAVYARAPVSLAIAVVIFPKVFRYVRNLLAHANTQPHVLAAHAHGLGTARILSHHLLPSIFPSLLALLGVSLSMAFGAAIPIEALCDSPGVGQLAWQATLNRDVPLVTALTLLVTFVTVSTNSFTHVAGRGDT